MVQETFTIIYDVKYSGPSREEVLSKIKSCPNGIAPYDLRKFFVESGKSAKVAHKVTWELMEGGEIVSKNLKLHLSDDFYDEDLEDLVEE